jgi:hypothetical protein
MGSIAHADVLVCGGGPAGIAAAVAAAEEGADVLLLEQAQYLGGAATAMMIPAFCPFGYEGDPVNAGLGLKILHEMKARMGDTSPRINWVAIDAEVLKSLYDEMVSAAGVRVRFGTLVVGAERDGARVTGVTVAGKNGLQGIEAGVVIDCTGDADVAAHAGCEFQFGGAQGEVMGTTLCFLLANVDKARFEAYCRESGDKSYIPLAVAKAREAHDFDVPEYRAAGFSFPYPDVAGINFGHVYGIDGSDPESVTRGIMEARRLVPKLLAFLHKWVPGFEASRLVATAPMLGVRETRRVVGDYLLTFEDYVARRSFEDDIARNSYFIDLHSASGAAELQRGAEGEEWHNYSAGESHGIPLRCLMPKGVDNLLVAGRPISVDRLVHSAIRVMPPCFATGEAAGVTAATMAAERLTSRQVDVPGLRDRLKARGARVDG